MGQAKRSPMRKGTSLEVWQVGLPQCRSGSGSGENESHIFELQHARPQTQDKGARTSGSSPTSDITGNFVSARDQSILQETDIYRKFVCTFDPMLILVGLGD